MKKFKIPDGQIKRLIGPVGGATAADMITVDGKDVGYMYRDKPINEHDTGWRFFAGEEGSDYINDLNNTGFYDINTIANCDPSIIPYLDEPTGTAWERIPGENEFQRVEK
jgi:hypothetical protein